MNPPGYRFKDAWGVGMLPFHQESQRGQPGPLAGELRVVGRRPQESMGCRSRRARRYERLWQQKFPQEYIQELIWGVCKSQATKKGPPFGEPF